MCRQYANGSVVRVSESRTVTELANWQTARDAPKSNGTLICLIIDNPSLMKLLIHPIGVPVACIYSFPTV